MSVERDDEDEGLLEVVDGENGLLRVVVVVDGEGGEDR